MIIPGKKCKKKCALEKEKRTKINGVWLCQKQSGWLIKEEREREREREGGRDRDREREMG